jgi:hypothetical protein
LSLRPYEICRPEATCLSSPKDLGAPRDAPKALKRAFGALPLLHFLVRRVLAAAAAEFLEFQPVRRRLFIFSGRVIPLFALTTL